MVILDVCVRQAPLNRKNDMVNHFADLHLLVRETSGGLRFMHLLLRDYFAGWARRHIPRWKEQMVEVLGPTRIDGAYHALIRWFADREVSELAQSAAREYFGYHPKKWGESSDYVRKMGRVQRSPRRRCLRLGYWGRSM